LQESWRLASGDGGESAAFGATLAHTAWMIGSKIGTATPPPVAIGKTQVDLCVESVDKPRRRALRSPTPNQTLAS
jgi:hypothetical protein